MLKKYIFIILLLFLMQPAFGIEVGYSLNDLTVNSEYDVDDSVYVHEEISGNPQDSTLQSSREVSGNGKMQGSQTISSGSLTASSSFQADSGSVQGSASLSPKRLQACQSASIAGNGAMASLAGWQEYLDGWAYTGQIVDTSSGTVRADQRLSLGRSIYSSQSYQADGISPLATGYSLVDLPGKSSSDRQGAIISSAAGRDGNIRGYMGAEVVVDPSLDNVDPVVYGRDMTSKGDSRALVVAAAGDWKDSWSDNQFASFNSLCGQAALAEAGAAGTDSRVSVDHLEARTDGEHSQAFLENARAKGGSLAFVGAAAGNLERSIEIGTRTYLPLVFVGPTQAAQSWPGSAITWPNTTWPTPAKPTMEYSRETASLQGAVVGAAAAGKESAPRAGYAKAGTDSRSTSAWGDDLSARSDGLATAGAASGSLASESMSSFNSGGADYSYWNYNTRSYALGTTTFAAGSGTGSRASSDFIAAGTDGGSSSSLAEGPKSKGDGFAAVFAGAGKIRHEEGGSGYIQQGTGASLAYVFSDYYAIAVGALDGGLNSRASAQTATSEISENHACTFARKMQSGPGGFGFFGVAFPSGRILLKMDLPLDSAKIEVFE